MLIIVQFEYFVTLIYAHWGGDGGRGVAALLKQQEVTFPNLLANPPKFFAAKNIDFLHKECYNGLCLNNKWVSARLFYAFRWKVRVRVFSYKTNFQAATKVYLRR